MAILGPFDFKGGYSPGYDFTTLPQGAGYALTMESCRFKDGFIAPRWGFVSVNSSSLSAGNGVKGLTSWIDTVNSKLALVATCNSKLWITDASAYFPSGTQLTFTDRTGAIAASSLSGLTTFDSLNNILVGSANSASSGVPFKVTAYNANGAALGGSPPSADIAKQCNNFMFLSRNLSSTTTQSNVYWSNVNDPETWTGANVLAFNKNDGEPVMALGSIGTDLYIFKKTSIGRLSTVTITSSGAVTLGPLVTVIKGVGCCGPRALDNLPNGNIVFVGQDSRFYEFDGSTLIDLSKKPYPGYDAFYSGTFYSNVLPNPGLQFGLSDVNTVVKTQKGINEVWITKTCQTLSNLTLTMAYSFEQEIWQGMMGNIFAGGVGALSYTTIPFLLSAVPASGLIESTDVLLWGDSNGFVWANGDLTHTYPATDGTGGRFVVGTTIQLIGQEGPFIPRSVCFETTYTANATTVTFLYGAYDIYSPASGSGAGAFTVFTSSTTLPTRVVAPLVFKQDSVGTNIFPTFLSLQWLIAPSGSSSSEVFRLGKFWISDDIIR